MSADLAASSIHRTLTMRTYRSPGCYGIEYWVTNGTPEGVTGRIERATSEEAWTAWGAVRASLSRSMERSPT